MNMNRLVQLKKKKKYTSDIYYSQMENLIDV